LCTGTHGPYNRTCDNRRRLTATQVAAEVAAGRSNAVDLRTSRTVTEIVRTNVFTFFNGLLLVLFAITIATGRWQNGLFGVVILANAGIGIVSEVRAKRTLDRLCVLNAPRARVVRDGDLTEIANEDVVLGDLLVLRSGDQVPADGIMALSADLEVDESLLTGESEPVVKSIGELVRSGSLVVAGTGRFRTTAVGAQAYAATIAADARRFTVARSELVEGTNRILRWISLLMLVVGPVLLWSQFHSADNHGWREAVTGAVAGMVGMVPEGLVLLTSLAFMLATITLARQHTLVQELPAIEGLARVDIVCLDKTGTLTYGDIAFDRLQLLPNGDEHEVRHALGLIADSSAGNATATAVAVAYPATDWVAADRVPFNSARKWSAITVPDHGTWVFGAPEMVLGNPSDPAQNEARASADRLAAGGARVLVLARSHEPPGQSDRAPLLPPDLVPAALIMLSERIRADAADTLQFFTEQGVDLKVISGDNPRTVGVVAAAVGVPGADHPIDARTLPEDRDGLADVLAEHSVFGRVSPHQKRAMVAALQSRGHVVAMTGDGVNDALALKDADIGIAMGNGSPATRAVAQLVLLDGQFAHLPGVVAEGRRVIANIERAANLFLVKNSYSLVLAVIAAASLSAHPLAPVQLTLISTVTIGVPGFVLALGPNRDCYVPGFVRRVLRFSVPVGVVTALSAYLGYRATRPLDHGADVAEGRTTATVVVLIVSLWTVVVLARPLTGWKLVLAGGLAGAVAVVLAVPRLGERIFLLSITPLDVAFAAAVGLAGAIFVEITHRAVEVMAAPRPSRA
jgi:cation-transporting ATPase E